MGLVWELRKSVSSMMMNILLIITGGRILFYQISISIPFLWIKLVWTSPFSCSKFEIGINLIYLFGFVKYFCDGN